jgi:hypothetical protein
MENLSLVEIERLGCNRVDILRVEVWSNPLQTSKTSKINIKIINQSIILSIHNTSKKTKTKYVRSTILRNSLFRCYTKINI